MADTTSRPRAGEPSRAKIHVLDVKKKAEKESSDRQGSLSQAKDRAQITASTCMSIVNVALLKEILDQGPKNNAYYSVSIGILATCLALQILAGMLSLFVSALMAYTNKHGGNCLGDCRENIFPWSCVKLRSQARRRRRRKKNNGLSRDDARSRAETGAGIEIGEVVVVANSSEEPSPNSNIRDKVGSSGTRPENQSESDSEDGFQCDWYLDADPQDHVLASEEDVFGCCTTCCNLLVTTEVYPSHECEVLEQFYHWRHLVVKDDLRAIEAAERLESRADVNIIETSEAKIKNMNDNLTVDGADVATLQSEISKLQGEIAAARNRKNQYEEAVRNNEIMHEQGKLLREVAEAIRKSRVVKVVSFWQDIINYILYVVFILNAFVVGFGIADNAPRQAIGTSDNPTNTSATSS